MDRRRVWGACSLGSRGWQWQAHVHVGAAGEPARDAPRAGHVGQAEYTVPCSGHPRPESLFRGRHGPPQPRPRTWFINGWHAAGWLISHHHHTRVVSSRVVLSQVSIPASCSACSFLVSASQTVTEPEPGAQRSGFWHSFLRCS
jgi:hypothetical protein